jgi:hypothetical protein
MTRFKHYVHTYIQTSLRDLCMQTNICTYIPIDLRRLKVCTVHICVSHTQRACHGSFRFPPDPKERCYMYPPFLVVQINVHGNRLPVEIVAAIVLVHQDIILHVLVGVLEACIPRLCTWL